MKRSLHTLTLVCALALTACASPIRPANNLPTQTADGEPLEQGLLLGSITAGSRVMNVEARFESTDGQGFWGKVQSENDLGHSAREYALRYANVVGDVFVMQVPAGSYAFTRWQMSTSETAQQSPDELQPLPFTVRPGETVYIGNIHFPLLKTLETAGGGPRMPTDTWAIANNRERRDADAIYQQYPELKDRFIHRRPLNADAWRTDYKALTGQRIADPLY